MTESHAQKSGVKRRSFIYYFDKASVVYVRYLRKAWVIFNRFLDWLEGPPKKKPEKKQVVVVDLEELEAYIKKKGGAANE